ncbi:hypothetical protein LUZ60_010544 [Juncus effusus]|nr:hypothetical protein LUZ60_010544 [Juncus effusus]
MAMQNSFTFSLLITIFFFNHVKSQVVFNVMSYGAKGDGTTDDSKAFQKSWSVACSSTQAAILLVPHNKKFLLKPIDFNGSCKSRIEIQIKGTIVAPSSQSPWSSHNRRHWMLFNGISDLTVTGGGTINGNGKIWWDNSCKVNKAKPCTEAPTAMTFYSCKNLVLRNLNVKNSQQIHVSIEKSNNVRVSNLAITAPSSSPNTDGIHVTSTTNIEITNCAIRTGDDCISIESGTNNLKATKIACGPGHGISIGSLGDDNSEAQVSRILIDTVKMNGTTNGARIKTWQGGSGYAKNIIFQNIVMHNVQNPIIIDQNYCDSQTPCKTQASAVEVSDVIFRNIRGTSATEIAIELDCSASVPCRGIMLEGINLVDKKNKPARSACQNARWSKAGMVVPTPCAYKT